MKLYKVQTKIINDVIDKVHILVDENANSIRRRLVIFERFQDLFCYLRLNITWTLFVEHQAKQVNSGISGCKNLIGSA